MRLHRLTGLEQEKLTEEYKLLLDTIRSLIEILEDPDVLLEVIRTELRNVKEEFGDDRRSEEHTSELQSLMRISYAVFCLKKKNKIYTYYYNQAVKSTTSQEPQS